MFLINQLHTNIETINYTKTLTHVLTVCTITVPRVMGSKLQARGEYQITTHGEWGQNKTQGDKRCP